MSRLHFCMRALAQMVCGILIFMSLQAHAYTCEFTNPYHDNLILPVIGPGFSTVGEDVPVGQVIYTTRMVIGAKYGDNLLKCEVSEEEWNGGVKDLNLNITSYRRIETISTPSGMPAISGSSAIYPTNVPGIGATITILSDKTTSTFPYYSESSKAMVLGTQENSFNMITRVELRLIKTGPIAPGTQQVLGADLPTFKVTGGLTSPYVMENEFYTISFSGVMTMYTRTCQLSSSVIDVSLGTYQRTDFTGAGSVSQWTDFDIMLRDCPAFVGYVSSTYQLTTEKETFTNTNNQVKIAFNSVHGVVDTNPLLAKLENNPTAAKGIAIEVADRNSGTSIYLDGSEGLSLQNLPTVDGSSYTIPLKARYVQYESTIQAGTANGAAVFTITYN